LAVALGTSVYLWNADTGAIDQLLDLEGADYITSLSWIPNGHLLAVGTSLGPVQVSTCLLLVCRTWRKFNYLFV
jgi:cell division cycle protein 20 (cofactor of APC complex)